jgi:transcriptional regulator with XRE-family HTH domain
MHTIEQIRAARALIGWSQGELADQAGLSQTGIARIENGTNRPNSNTLTKIRAAFDRVDIEFIDDSGVKKRSNHVRILQGADGLRQFFDELYETARDIGGDICLFNGVPSKLSEWLGVDWYEMHNKRMEEIRDNYHYKIIVKEGETSLPAADYATYKFFPEELFNDRTIYIFGNTVFFRDQGDSDLRLIRIEQADLANSMKILFDIAWNNVAKDAA